MAAFLPDAKTLRVEQTFGDEDGHVAQCRFFLTYAGSAPTNADLVVMATASNLAAIAQLGPVMHNTWTIGVTIITDLTSDTAAQGEHNDGGGGTLVGGRLPASTSLVVAQTTGRRFRGGHSRVYLPVGDDTKLLTDATWVAAFVTSVTTAWETVVSDTAGGAWAGAGTITAVMASFFLGFTNEPYGSPVKYRRVPTPRAVAVNFPIVTYVGRSAIGTQRRRLRAG